MSDSQSIGMEAMLVGDVEGRNNESLAPRSRSRLPPHPPALPTSTTTRSGSTAAAINRRAASGGRHTPRRNVPSVTASEAGQGGGTTPRQRRNSTSLMSHHTNASTGSTHTNSSVTSSVAAAKLQFNVLCHEEEGEISEKRDLIRKGVKEAAYATLLTTTPIVLDVESTIILESAEGRCKMAVEWMMMSPTTTSSTVKKSDASPRQLAADLHSHLSTIGSCVHRERRRINLAALRQQKRSRKPSNVTKRQLEESALFLEAISSSISIPSIIGAVPSYLLSGRGEDASRIHSELLLRTVVEAATTSLLDKLSSTSDVSAPLSRVTNCSESAEEKMAQTKSTTTRSMDEMEVVFNNVIARCVGGSEDGSPNRRQSRHRRQEEQAKKEASIEREKPLFAYLYDLLQEQPTATPDGTTGINSPPRDDSDETPKDADLPPPPVTTPRVAINEGFVSKLAALDVFQGRHDDTAKLENLFDRVPKDSLHSETNQSTLEEIVSGLGITPFSAYTLGKELLSQYKSHVTSTLGGGITLSEGPLPKRDLAAVVIPFTLVELVPPPSSTTSASDPAKRAAMGLLLRVTNIHRLHAVLSSAVLLLSIACELLGDQQNNNAAPWSLHQDPSETVVNHNSQQDPDSLAQALVGTVEGGGVADALQAPSFLTRFPKQFFTGDAHCYLGLAVRELDRLHAEVLQRLPTTLIDDAALWLRTDVATALSTTKKNNNHTSSSSSLSPSEFAAVVPASTIESFPVLLQRLLCELPSNQITASLRFGGWVLQQAPRACRELLGRDDITVSSSKWAIQVRHCMMKCLELNDGNHPLAWKVLAEELPNGEEVTIGDEATTIKKPNNTTATKTAPVLPLMMTPSSVQAGSTDHSNVQENSIRSVGSSSIATISNRSTNNNRMMVSTLGEIRSATRNSNVGTPRGTAGSRINATNGYFTAGYATALVASRKTESVISTSSRIVNPATDDEDGDGPPPLLGANTSGQQDDGEIEHQLTAPEHPHSNSNPLQGAFLGDHNKTTCYCEAIRCSGGYNHATTPYLLETLWLPLAQSMVFSHNPEVGAEEVLIAVEKNTWYDNADTEVVTLDKLQILLHILSLERVSVPAAYFELGQLVELSFSTTTVHADPQTGCIKVGSIPSSMGIHSSRQLLSNEEIEMVLTAADEFMPYDGDRCGQKLRMNLEAMRRVFYPVLPTENGQEEIIEEIDESDPEDPACTFNMILPTADENTLLRQVVSCKNIRVVRESKVDVCFDSFTPLISTTRGAATSTGTAEIFDVDPLSPRSAGDDEDVEPTTSSLQTLSLSRVDCYCLGLSLVPTSHSGLWMRLAMAMEDIGQCRFKESVEIIRAAICFSRRVLAANQELIIARNAERIEKGTAVGDMTKKGWSMSRINTPISTTPVAYRTIPVEYLGALGSDNKIKMIYNEIVHPVPEAEQLLVSANCGGEEDASSKVRSAFDRMCMDIATSINKEEIAAEAGRPLGQLLEYSAEVYRRAVMVMDDEDTDVAVFGGEGGDGTFTRIESLVMAVRASEGNDAKAWFVLGTCLGERSLTRRKNGLSYRGFDGTRDISQTGEEFQFCMASELITVNKALQEKADACLKETVEMPSYLIPMLRIPHTASSSARHQNNTNTPSTVASIASRFQDSLISEDGLVVVDAQLCFAQAVGLSPTSMKSLADSWRRKLAS